jgi:hypothetical protein
MVELAEALAGRPGNQHLHLDLARPLISARTQDLVQQVAAVLCVHLNSASGWFS